MQQTAYTINGTGLKTGNFRPEIIKKRVGNRQRPLHPLILPLRERPLLAGKLFDG